MRHRHPEKPDAAGFAQTLAAKYRAGMTLRQIGAEIGRCHETVRFRLKKLPGYRRMVSGMLLKRLRETRVAFAITRTRENRRRMKHAAAMVRRHRPEILKQLSESVRPKACAGCGRAVAAKQLAGLWFWDCGHCGESGITPPARIAAPEPRR